MRKSSAAATRDSHDNLYIPVYKEIHTVPPDNGSGPRSITINQPLLDQYGGKVKARIQLDLYGDGKVVLPLPEPSWNEADEQRRQQMLTEKRIEPVGQAAVAGLPGKNGLESEPKPGLDKPIFIEKIAGPPSPADGHILAP